jgi:hypothetical protein
LQVIPFAASALGDGNDVIDVVFASKGFFASGAFVFL